MHMTFQFICWSL